MCGKRTACSYGSGETKTEVVNSTSIVEGSNKMRILYLNADCLTNKKEELHMRIRNYKAEPDIIAITEVKPKKCFV